MMIFFIGFVMMIETYFKNWIVNGYLKYSPSFVFIEPYIIRKNSAIFKKQNKTIAIIAIEIIPTLFSIDNLSKIKLPFSMSWKLILANKVNNKVGTEISNNKSEYKKILN
jgi:hypothetical protein